jgi:hypothetical protein
VLIVRGLSCQHALGLGDRRRARSRGHVSLEAPELGSVFVVRLLLLARAI